MKKYFALVIAASFMGCDKEDSIKADFSYSGIVQNFTPIQFTNTSVGATRVNWKFSDGASTTEENPVHIFRKAGEASVELEVFGINSSNRKVQKFKLAQADTMSIIISSTIGDYSLTKVVYTSHVFATGKKTYSTEKCDRVIKVTRINNEIQIDGYTPNFRYNGLNSLYNNSYYFTAFRGFSGANIDIALFKLGTDSIKYDQGSGGSGGQYHTIYYGKKL